MTTRTITYHVCDGCGRSDLFDGVEIVESVPRYFWHPDGLTLDLCEVCAEGGLYICSRCRRVHGDEDPCAVRVWKGRIR